MTLSAASGLGRVRAGCDAAGPDRPFAGTVASGEAVGERGCYDIAAKSYSPSLSRTIPRPWRPGAIFSQRTGLVVLTAGPVLRHDGGPMSDVAMVVSAVEAFTYAEAPQPTPVVGAG
jgi:hypothetical protein